MSAVEPRRSLVAVVPAAGESRRFGSAKLTAEIGGVPLLGRTLGSLLDAGVDRIVVITREGARVAGVRALDDPRVTTRINPDPDRGMFSSIQTGLSIAGGDIVLVLPGDMPFVAADTVRAIAARAAATGTLVVPVHDGRRGHPIAIPGPLCAGLIALDAGTTLKDALASLGTQRDLFEVADAGVLRDVDVPGDLSGSP